MLLIRKGVRISTKRGASITSRHLSLLSPVRISRSMIPRVGVKSGYRSHIKPALYVSPKYSCTRVHVLYIRAPSNSNPQPPPCNLQSSFKIRLYIYACTHRLMTHPLWPRIQAPPLSPMLLGYRVVYCGVEHFAGCGATVQGLSR